MLFLCVVIPCGLTVVTIFLETETVPQKDFNILPYLVIGLQDSVILISTALLIFGRRESLSGYAPGH
jgi:hypothetical protein